MNNVIRERKDSSCFLNEDFKGAAYIKEYANYTSLMLCAALPDNFECFMVLIKNGAKYDTLDSHGNTLLHVAALNGNNQAIKYIAENLKIDMHASNLKGEKAAAMC